MGTAIKTEGVLQLAQLMAMGTALKIEMGTIDGSWNRNVSSALHAYYNTVSLSNGNSAREERKSNVSIYQKQKQSWDQQRELASE